MGHFVMSNFFLPGTASLIEELDKRILVVLRDGRTLIGILRSFDHYANVVLENTTERLFVGNAYGDIPIGLFVVRGDNIVLIGDINPQKEQGSPLRRVSVEEILHLYAKAQGSTEEPGKGVIQSIRDDNAITDSYE